MFRMIIAFIITGQMFIAAAGSALVAPPGGSGPRGHGYRHGQQNNLSIPGGITIREMTGREWTSDSLRGKIVIMDFWAPWCAPCLQQIPRLKKIHETYRGRDVLLFGINVDRADRRSQIRWLRRNAGKMVWPQLDNRRGLNGDLPRHFAVSQVPEILVFNRRGELVSRGTSSGGLEQVIESLLKEDDYHNPGQGTNSRD